MNNLAEKLFAANEPYAAGYFEYEDRDIFLRCAHAHAVFLKHAALPQYDGGSLFPCGGIATIFDAGAPAVYGCYGMIPHYWSTYQYRPWIIEAKNPGLTSEIHGVNEDGFFAICNTVHNVAGFGYTHSLPYYGRILKEGLSSYRDRVEKRCTGAFREGLLELIDAIDVYRKRCVEYLRDAGAKHELVKALEKVPMRPAGNIYEAMVGYNFIYYLDGCDNIGRLDTDLYPFWKGEDIVPLLREFFKLVDDTNGYSASLGPDYNELTLQCIKAINGKRRPQIELRITEDMPDEIWKEVISSLAAGGTNPTLYNENGYEKAFKLKFPEMPHEDYMRFCGVGCTESSLAGISLAGSIDIGMHMPYIFESYMNENLEKCENFDEFFEGYISKYRSELEKTIDQLAKFYEIRAKNRPNPMRSLLIDDCIDKDTDFHNGGARWSWSVVNFSGIVNITEDLLAIKELVYDSRRYTPSEFKTKLAEGNAEFKAACRRCPHYGVDDDGADAMAYMLANRLFDELEEKRNYLGGRFLPCSIQFNTCATAGSIVGPTPDGRSCGAALADSIAAIAGNDKNGITAMLNSAAKLPQERMPGTAVLNLKLEKNFLKNNLKAVTLGYFAKGGLQLQISCLSKEDMEDAMVHPENHGNLIVRVGGYSEYFVRLTKELQINMIQRTEFK